MLFFLPISNISQRMWKNIGGVTALQSNFNWIPPNDADLYICEITGVHAKQCCENGYADLFNC